MSIYNVTENEWRQVIGTTSVFRDSGYAIGRARQYADVNINGESTLWIGADLKAIGLYQDYDVQVATTSSILLSAANPTGTPSSSSGLSTGAIIGIVVGSVINIILIAIGIYYGVKAG